ncbi:MAG: FAD-dependent oxidoreductase [Planctomycetota bacterium]
MRVAVVGGGVTGLSVARELVRRGRAVTLFAKGQVGGLAGGFPYPDCPGVYLDRFYHHIFTSDTALVDLIQEHGLEDDLLWLPSKSGLIAQGRLWPFAGALDLLRFSPLGSLPQRMLMGWNLLRIKQCSDWRRLDSVRCREFFERRGNLAGYRNLWEPLLKQKFADAFDDIPAAFLWGRLCPRAGSRSRARECLGYLKGGFQRLFLRMKEAITAGGGEVRTGSPVRRFRAGERPEIVSPRGGGRFDRVVWTASLEELLAAVCDPPAEFARQVEAIEYVAVTQLILVMKRRQTDYYWLNNIDPEHTFGGIIEHTNLASPDDYGGEHILYVVNYHRRGDPQFRGQTAATLLDYHLPSLKRTLPGFSCEDIVRLHAIRATYSSPLYDLGYGQRMPPYQGWLPNVDLCTQAQVYPRDRNMSHCAENALRYVNEVYGGGSAARPTRGAPGIRQSRSC